MSIKLMTAVWETNIGPATRRLILLALADIANDEGEGWPSIETLARRASCSRSAAENSLRALAEDGIITRDSRGFHRSNLYRINLSTLTPRSRGSAPVTPKSRVDDPQILRVETPRFTGTEPSVEPPEEPNLLSETPDGAPNQDSQDAKQQPPTRPDVVQLCNRLRDLMIGNGCKPPTVGKQWETAARLLLDRDKRDLREALWMLGWCQRDEFWRTNVLSMPTFRARYDQLVLRAKAEVGRRRNGQGPAGDASGEPMVPVQVHRGGQRLVPARWFSVTAPPEDWDPAHDPFDRVPGPDLPDWHWRRHNEQ